MAVQVEIAIVAAIEPQAMDLDLVHADAQLLVINKPAGLVVHPGAGNRAGTLQNALLHFDPLLATLPRAGSSIGSTRTRQVCWSWPAQWRRSYGLTRQMQQREIERRYEAVCSGVMTAGGVQLTSRSGVIVHDRVRMAVREDGRDAVTHYRVLERFRAHTRAGQPGNGAHLACTSRMFVTLWSATGPTEGGSCCRAAQTTLVAAPERFQASAACRRAGASPRAAALSNGKRPCRDLRELLDLAPGRL